MSVESHGLTGILGEIADLVGIHAALAVAEKVGGTRAYIARKPGADHWLVQAVGPVKAEIIVDYFTTGRSGIELDFPVGPRGSYNAQQRARAKHLRELTEKGLSTSQVARQAGMTRRGVQMFKAREREREAGDDDAPTFDF